jgi:hypothetical protein
MRNALHWLFVTHAKPIAFVFGIIFGLEVATALRISSVSPRVNPAYGYNQIRMIRT